MEELGQKIVEAVLSQGFAAVGFAKAEYMAEEAERFSEWLQAGNSADMDYLKRNNEKRFDPSKLVPGARSVVIALFPYLTTQSQVSRFKISKYAHVADYHGMVKSRLRKVVEAVPEIAMPMQQCFCDSAPLLERSLAMRAGLGRIGKNTTLINDKLGSYFFIGEIVVPVELPYGVPEQGSPCGSCRRCIESCPAGALSEDMGLDARKCLSYITIESKGDVSDYAAVKENSVLFGCDKCLDVCPWNIKNRTNAVNAELEPMPYLSWSDEQWQALDEHAFKEFGRNSSLKRAGYEKIRKGIDFLS